MAPFINFLVKAIINILLWKQGGDRGPEMSDKFFFSLTNLKLKKPVFLGLRGLMCKTLFKEFVSLKLVPPVPKGVKKVKILF